MTIVVYHTPVFLDEIARLAAGSHRIVDCTVGGGGHLSRLIGGAAAVLAIDRDPKAIVVAQRRVPDKKVRWLNAGFGDAKSLEAIIHFGPDFVLVDLGVSGHQLDSSGRGFTFRPGAPLDMRMSSAGESTAAQLLNTLDQGELARMFREYGDERRARRLASVIVRRRRKCPLETSDDLVNAIREALGPRSGPSDFARLFQAVRIELNDELGQLRTALPSLLDALTAGGILAVISYHSGEDRIVKRFFFSSARACVCPPNVPLCVCRGRPLGVVQPKKPIRPGAEELSANPRSRSAKLRIFRKADETQR